MDLPDQDVGAETYPPMPLEAQTGTQPDNDAGTLDAARLQAIADLHHLVEQVEFDADIETVVQSIVERARVLTRAEGMAVGRVEGDEMFYPVVVGAPQLVGFRYRIDESLAGLSVQTGQTLVSADAPNDPRVNQRARALGGIRSIVSVPLRRRGEVFGVLVVFSTEANQFPDSTAYTVELIAGAISVAYGHAADLADKRVLLDAVQGRQRLLETLLSIQRAISGRRPLQEVLDAITSGASGLLDGAVVALVLRGPPDDQPSIASRYGPALSAEERAGKLAVAVEAMDTDGTVWHPFGEAGLFIATPVRVGEAISGSLVAHLDVGISQIGENAELIAAFAQQVSLALTDAWTLQEMNEAYRDPITSLPNRARFLDRLRHALADSAANGEELAVIFVDLDRFKEVNDGFGHGVGDEMLAEVANRIRTWVGNADVAARLGGDEFAVMLRATGHAGAVALAERIIRAIREPFRLAGRDLFVGASAGVTSNLTSRPDAVEMLSNADVAMYHAKKSRPGTVAMFEPHMQWALIRRLELHSDLQHALAHSELTLQYQPLFRLYSSEPVGVEALLRWTHAERGPVPPAEFVPVAEDTDLIVDIGRWVLWQGVRQAVEWQPTVPGLTINVNVSARQLADADFVDDVAEVLAATGLPANLLTLELTESVLMSEPNAVLPRIRQLKSLGVRLAVDDFGTGYSSLAYLVQFPVDELKIDRSFVAAMSAGPTNLAVVRTIVELAHTLNLHTVAEGIETADQLQALVRLGVDFGQGYHLARPLDPDAAYEFLIRHVAMAR